MYNGLKIGINQFLKCMRQCTNKQQAINHEKGKCLDQTKKISQEKSQMHH